MHRASVLEPGLAHHGDGGLVSTGMDYHRFREHAPRRRIYRLTALNDVALRLQADVLDLLGASGDAELRVLLTRLRRV